jgi:hypothetical protein
MKLVKNGYSLDLIIQGGKIGAVILHFLGFGIIIVVGIDPNEAQVGDVAVEIVHNGFYTCAQV